ncbi:MAG: DUF1549 domain-containing protein [Verrucomicrobiota bacterium]
MKHRGNTINFWTQYYLLSALIVLTPSAKAKDFTAEQIEFFETKIRPVLAQECYECHNSRTKDKGGLILDYRDGLLDGGDTGPAIEPGDAEGSLLIEALKHLNDLEMPKAGVMLDAPIIADFEKWINMGAPDPRDAPPTDEELANDTSWDSIFETRRNWWSFQPVDDPAVPEGDGTPIDRFVQKGLEANGLKAADQAEPLVLARRLYYTLVGLPPTTEQLLAFETAASENADAAIDDLIDDLLGSSQFGEKWARHWMDWVRYAESHGSEGDPRIDNAHFYRDYLIRALNQDIPYDQLLREHVAGDLLESPRFNDELGINESTLGAMHWRMVFHGFAPTDALDEKVRFTDDQINTFTKAFQGLTVSCARCHNHKFDAISQADYYAMFGVLGGTRPGKKLVDTEEKLQLNKRELTELKKQIKAAVANDWLSEIDSIKGKIVSNYSNWNSNPEAKRLFQILDDYQKNKNGKGRWESARQDGLKFTAAIEATREWDLKGDDEQWFSYGNGSADKTVDAGTFSIGTGEKAVDHIFPSGRYSHNLSDKHASRLTSSDFDLDGELTLHILAQGQGKSHARYVVQNYPRKGTVFKVTEMDDNEKSPQRWKWHPFSLKYWNGDSVHIELATARDSAVLSRPIDRSWFGLRRAVLIEEGKPAPPSPDLEPLAALLEHAPNDFDGAAQAIADSIKEALTAWKDGGLSDAQARLLDLALSLELLSNAPADLASADPLLTQYRELEEAVPVATRVPGLDEWAAPDQPLYDRGDHKKPLDPVERRYIQAVDMEPFTSQQSGRLEMADAMFAESNTFTQRVIVNRIWTHLFGDGIVGSVDNFGRLGEAESIAWRFRRS